MGENILITSTVMYGRGQYVYEFFILSRGFIQLLILLALHYTTTYLWVPFFELGEQITMNIL